MSTIGENRLSIYNLLYAHPLYEYANKKNELNVLILGNGWIGNEAFKAIFWCGLYPNIKLNITIASQNAEHYKESLIKYLPGLKQFANFDGNETSKYHYANIRVKSVSFEKIKGAGITDDICGKNCLDISNQNYIIVAVGDSEINYLVADELANHFPTGEKNA